ncbi:MAG: amidase [Phenylobacterium sp. RIFCSPHIGHO2_01_FULL_69_31]|uniref:amidase n=1 Tax=unclassified Phenylobacterium TaxID=2640670 RepID=UPI0008BA8B7F|nr:MULTISPECIES: amidase [unclassified Phenylobacterium]OHB26879.1 MAG: amidase [Phenylobacterium sp. RIFCSPHIGHO2_01_FULL_69_31]TAJ69381.1 MAG: amidase [Phenylobacterium sp.]
MTKTSIWQWTAVETARAVREGQVSAVEVVQAHLARMSIANPPLNAVVVPLAADALSAAKAADAHQASGAELGPLHGVPITIKINVDVAGQANSNGVVAFKDNIAQEDAPVVANLRRAGAILLGLTNTPEFSLRAFTDNPLHGMTFNPWDAGITCGGSSGGAAAAVAAGIGAIAHGNDIGGSLRWPAHCNGVVTIKPTQGRIAAYNPTAMEERALVSQLMSAQGPLTRTVEDARVALEVMSAQDRRDPWYAPAPLDGDSVPRRAAIARIPDDMDCDPAVVALYRQAGEHLAAAGYELEEVEVPELSAVWGLWRDLLFAEFAVMQAPLMRKVGSDAFKRLIEASLASSTVTDLEGYMRGIARRTGFIRTWMEFLERHPVLLTPVSVQRTPGPNADVDGSARNLFWKGLRFVGPVNLLGLPAAVVPVGLVDGAPIGVQLIATRFREDLCLQAAAAIESRAGPVVPRLWAREERSADGVQCRTHGGEHTGRE